MKQLLIILSITASLMSCSEGTNDSNLLQNDMGGDSGENTVAQSDPIALADEEGALLDKLIGPAISQRVWICERTNDDGSVHDVVLEFGALPEFDRNWVRFIDPARAATESFYRVVSRGEDSLRLSVPGIERVGSIFQSEYDSRTRGISDIVLTGADTFSATYVELRSSGPDLRPSFDCQRSTRIQASQSGITTWPSSRSWPITPNIQEVAGLSYSSTRQINVIDECNDGTDISLKFYETLNGVETGLGWPSAYGDSNAYGVGATLSGFNLSCAYGTDVCHSAEPSDGRGGSWGLDPNLPYQQRGCENCCFECPLPLLSSPTIKITLSC